MAAPALAYAIGELLSVNRISEMSLCVPNLYRRIFASAIALINLRDQWASVTLTLNSASVPLPLREKTIR